MWSERITAGAVNAIERGWVPDSLTRWGMRRLLAKRLKSLAIEDSASERFRDSLTSGEIAPLPAKANEQHYEVPAELYALMLGKRRKYSSCFYASPETTLDQAEEAALTVTCERAEITDGMSVLELGCGWGSLTLWMLEKYPHLKVTAISNSHSQRAYITAEAQSRGYADRLRVLTLDMNDFQLTEKFDRIVSVEMFEHMRNYRELLKRLARCLNPSGKLFVHIFCHRERAYPFEAEGSANWMGRYFFSGGMMPNFEIFSIAPHDLRVERSWKWTGWHYQRTSKDWVRNIDRNRSEIMPILAKIYGPSVASIWLQRWRLLFLAGAELFGYRGGEEWFVGHYLLVPHAVHA